ncbi:hypothetical protein SCHIN_v1c11430 [Spiroplasma chinense]|uniref:Uncharacterized protein n=1 Tax=Spiroplasma chinense TaxID=216932 RepID=A0A5B9Y6J2_9MOLU|nr:hypothetical protein [Spiroplasma chinense]QEH62336.1 hypothetical protein SCHIN_v1c11430 [Spiroplasma chinense]
MIKLLSLLASATMGVTPIAANVQGIQSVQAKESIDISMIDGFEKDFQSSFATHNYNSFISIAELFAIEAFENEGVQVESSWLSLSDVVSDVDGREISNQDISGMANGAGSEVWNIKVSATQEGLENGLVGQATIKVNLIFKAGDLSTLSAQTLELPTYYTTVIGINNYAREVLMDTVVYTVDNAIFFAYMGGADWTAIQKFDEESNEYVALTQTDVNDLVVSGETLPVTIVLYSNVYGNSKGLTGYAVFNINLSISILG